MTRDGFNGIVPLLNRGKEIKINGREQACAGNKCP